MENKTKGKTEQWNKIFKIYAHKEYIHDFLRLNLIAELKRSRIFGKHFLVEHQAEKIWLWRHRTSESPSVQILEGGGRGRKGRGEWGRLGRGGEGSQVINEQTDQTCFSRVNTAEKVLDRWSMEKISSIHAVFTTFAGRFYLEDLRWGELAACGKRLFVAETFVSFL